MKKFSLFFHLVCSSCIVARKYFYPDRIEQIVNRNRSFNCLLSEEDLSVVDPVYDDCQRSVVLLPYIWMIYETIGDIHPYIVSLFERDIAENIRYGMNFYFMRTVHYFYYDSIGYNFNDRHEIITEEDTMRIIHEQKQMMYGDYVMRHASNLEMENLLRMTIRGWYSKDVKNLEPQNNSKVLKSGRLPEPEEWRHKMARVQDESMQGWAV